MINKKSQEEIAGFALIIVVVAVILVIFLGFAIRKPAVEIQSSEAESFVQAFLSYTSECSKAYETDYLSIRQLIEACSRNEICLNEKDTCEILNSTVKDLIKESWNIGKTSFVKGYNLEVIYSGKNVLSIREGNLTGNYKSSIQNLPDNLDVKFKVYS